MKKLVFALITIGLLFSCNKNDDSGPETALVGNWKLIEVLIDSGDGNGSFVAVVSDKIITFKSDGSISSNGNLCDMSITSDIDTEGTYSSSQSTFNSSECDNPDYNFTFQQSGDILIIDYPFCAEPCKAKYKKE